MTTDHDLLVEPLLSWRDAARRRSKATLPGILARLGSGELADFPRVRAHQFHPWCMFLTQLAAIALHRAGQEDPARSEEEWTSLLLGLTGGDQEPWCLVVDDLSKPGFFQPPVPEGSIDEWNSDKSPVPDLLDVLATAKNHDVKQHTTHADDRELWVYALCTLQTTQAFYGAGNWGIARKFKGYGTRVRVGLSRSLGVSDQFQRDIAVMLDGWADVASQHGFREDGIALVWQEPWDGSESLQAGRLAPHFIEVCRRIRLTQRAHLLGCRTTPTKVARCMHRIVETGDVGDPWIPIRRENAAALNLGARGVHYELTADVLFGTSYKEAATQRVRAEDPDAMLFTIAALARGEGATEGLHQRILPLSKSVKWRLRQRGGRDAVGRRASQNVERAKRMGAAVLSPAVTKLSLGTKQKKDFAKNAMREFESQVDDVFFNDLFAMLESADDEAQLAWDRRLHGIAALELQRAINRCCVPSSRWYHAVSDAESVFHGCLNKQFPTLVSSSK